MSNFALNCELLKFENVCLIEQGYIFAQYCNVRIMKTAHMHLGGMNQFNV